MNEKNQKKMERTMQTSCKLECLSQTEPRGTGAGGGGKPPPSVYPSWCNRSIVCFVCVCVCVEYVECVECV